MERVKFNIVCEYSKFLFSLVSYMLGEERERKTNLIRKRNNNNRKTTSKMW